MESVVLSLCGGCSSKPVSHRKEDPALCEECLAAGVKVSAEPSSGVEEEWMEGIDEEEEGGVVSWLPCNWCQVKFSDSEALAHHQAESRGCRPFVCQHCGCSFASVEKLTEHNEEHVEEISSISEGSVYEIEASDDLSYAVEKLTKGNKEQPSVSAGPPSDVKEEGMDDGVVRSLPCNWCQAKFSDSEALGQHQAESKGCRPFVCQHCGCSFASVENLTEHKKEEHVEDGSTISEDSIHEIDAFEAVSFANKQPRSVSARPPSDVVEERMEGIDEEEDGVVSGLPCNWCQAKFSDSEALGQHQAESRGCRPFVCQRCGCSFASVEKLTEHNKEEHADELSELSEVETFQCEVCSHTFDAGGSALTDDGPGTSQATGTNSRRVCDACRSHSASGPSNNFSKNIWLQFSKNPAIIHDGSETGKFACKICCEQFPSTILLERHLQKHVRRTIHICRYCLQVFLRQAPREKHQLECTRGDNSDSIFQVLHDVQFNGEERKKEFACVLCNQWQQSLKDLENHLTRHIQHSVFLCQICQYAFGSITERDGHIEICQGGDNRQTCFDLKRRLHEAKTSRKFDCKLCGYRSEKCVDLERHLREHFTQKIYLCGSCVKIFSKLKTKDKHEARCKGGNKSHSMVVFHRRYMRHQDQTREERKPEFACKICFQHQVSISELQKHLVSHFRKKKKDLQLFLCSSCQYSFITHEELDSHLAVCSGGDNSQTIFRLLSAEEIKDSQKFKQEFACPFCHRRNETMRTLEVHLSYQHVTHRKVFLCYKCKHGFNNFSKRKKHEKKCTGGDNSATIKELLVEKNRLICKLCGLQTPTVQKLESHFKDHTKRNVAVCCKCHHAFFSVKDKDTHEASCPGGDNSYSILQLMRGDV